MAVEVQVRRHGSKYGPRDEGSRSRERGTQEAGRAAGLGIASLHIEYRFSKVSVTSHQHNLAYRIGLWRIPRFA